MAVSNAQRSSSASKSVVSFNLSDQQDVAKLLGYVRGSELDSEEKNVVRNLVFEYGRTHYAALATDLNELLAAINVSVKLEAGIAANVPPESTTTPEPAAASTPTPIAAAAPAKTSTIGRPRTKPSFGSVIKQKSEPDPTPTPEPVAAATTSKQSDSQSQPEPATPTATNQPEPPRPAAEPLAESKPTPTPEPVVAPDTTPTPETEPVTTTPEPAAQPPAVAPESAPTPVSTQNTDATTRIKEIKRAVNEKVGNPVNLIDANNEIGREYMNALLDAMKKVNGAPAGEVAVAMQRLEAAYSAVQKMIADGLPATPPESAAPAPAPQPESQPEKSVAPEPAPVTPIKTPEPPVPKPAPASAASAPAVPHPATGGLRSVAATTQASRIDPQTYFAKPDSIKKDEPAAQTTPVSTAAPITSEPSKEQSPNPVTKPDIAHTAKVPSAELMTEAITSGLNQLLSEWKLFKSSGIFGTGPSGAEHPLYKTLATLPMSSVIAGRFEGATAEVKQSLTDYMNGWRYEQGVVHDMDETFEHYLRRVIAVILEKQPPKSDR